MYGDCTRAAEQVSVPSLTPLTCQRVSDLTFVPGQGDLAELTPITRSLCDQLIYYMAQHPEAQMRGLIFHVLKYFLYALQVCWQPHGGFDASFLCKTLLLVSLQALCRQFDAVPSCEAGPQHGVVVWAKVDAHAGLLKEITSPRANPNLRSMALQMVQQTLNTEWQAPGACSEVLVIDWYEHVYVSQSSEESCIACLTKFIHALAT
jgi:hypothetical protein